MKERFFAAVNGAMGPNLLRVHTSPGTTGILLRCVQLVFLVIWPLISAVRGRQLLIMSTQLYHNLVIALDKVFNWVENLVSLCAFL